MEIIVNEKKDSSFEATLGLRIKFEGGRLTVKNSFGLNEVIKK